MEKYLYQDLYDLEDRHWWHIAKRKSVSTFIDQFITSKKPKILDIGCGTGRNIKELSKFGQVWGLDISSEALSFCKKRGITKVRLGTAQKTNFPEKTFDIVTLLDVLEHVNELSTLNEINRILKNGGFIIITVPAFNFLWSEWDKVLHHKRRYTKKSLQKILVASGFKVTKISYLYSFLILPTMIIRFLKSAFLKKSYKSDFQILPPFLNSFLGIVSSIERAVMIKKDIPFGTSILCIAKKNEDKT